MEMVLLCGIQASGKSTFCKERLFATHIRINMDMLKTRHREEAIFSACIATEQPFVVDNTNASRAERGKYIAAARAAGFKVIGYYFESRVAASVERNATRAAHEQIPERGIKGTSARLEIPARNEGFDELYYVRIGNRSFDVQEWRDEV